MFEMLRKLLICGVIAAITVRSYCDKSNVEEWMNVAIKLQKQYKETNFAGKDKDSFKLPDMSQFNVDITCSIQEGQEPTSVHQLRPQDIDVVGAMGDSLTAGNGANATDVRGILMEYRGLSWAAGGQEGEAETILTMPNILRTFNPDLKGFSIGSRFEVDKDWGFNVAVPGSRARDMPRQAKLMIEKMKESPEVNFEEDWKLVNVFIGGNDLCAIRRSADARPQKYIQYLQEGLDVLHSGMTRTLVNLVNILEIYHLPQVAHGYGSTDQCRRAQKTLCNYIVEADDKELEDIKQINHEYQDLIDNLVKSGKYDTRDDFTVVVQPFLRNTVLPYTEDGQVDATYFAPDCFHFSMKGHAMGAINLWNNMLEPVGQKTTEWSLKELICPSEAKPYIFTSKNSLLQSSSKSETGNQINSHLSNLEVDAVLNCDDICTASNGLDDWVIALLCVLATAVLIQIVFIGIMLNSKSYKISGKKVLIEG